MPHDTIVVNQGDSQTDVPDGNSVQQPILPLSVTKKIVDFCVNTNEEVKNEVPPCQLQQPDVLLTESSNADCYSSDNLTSRSNRTSEEIPNSLTSSTDTSDTEVPVSGSPLKEISRSTPQTISTQPKMEALNNNSKGQGNYVSSMHSDESPQISHGCDLGSFNVASNKGWGIPSGLGLRGGGMNSLNNGTSGWGAPPSNSNAASATGWGAPPGSGGSAGGNPSGANQGNNAGIPVGPGNQAQQNVGANAGSSASASSSSPPGCGNMSTAVTNVPNGTNQWASTSPNRNTSQNTNGQNTAISGSQLNNNPSGNSSGGPQGGNSMQMGNQNMMNSGSNPMSQASSNQNQASGAAASWAQAAGKSLQQSSNSSTTCGTNQSGGQGVPNSNASGNNINAQSVPGGGNGTQAGTSSVGMTSKQMEQLTQMRDALFSHDGWGGHNVNQDSSWDIPSSPEPVHKDLGMGSSSMGGSSVPWKVNVNNGTDLWEANLRNGGAPPPQPPAQKTPWGHTPTTNIGGTWGEDDDGNDQSSVWNTPSGSNAPGPSNASQNPNAGGMGGNMQWGMNSGPQQPPQRDPTNPMWGAAPMKKEMPDWGNAGNAGRGGPGNHPVGDRNAGGGMWNKPGPPQGNQWGGGGPPGNVAPGPGNMGMNNPMGVGAAGGMHGGSVNMKDPMMTKPGGGGGGGGWDDASPPTQRRHVPNIPNYDDGTSLWGQQQQAQQQPRGMPPNRGGGMVTNKMDGTGAPMGWPSHNASIANARRNGWQPDGQQDNFGGGAGGGQGRNDDKGSSWGEPPMHQSNSWGKPKTPTNPNFGGWIDDGLIDTTSWGGQPKNNSSRYFNGNTKNNLTKDHYHWNSPLFSDMGSKKDDIDLARLTSSIGLGDTDDRVPPMDQNMWGAPGSGPMPQQRRGPLPDDHFGLDLGGPGGPMGMGPPPQQRGGNSGFPNHGGFGGGGNSMMNNGGNPILKMLSQQQNQPLIGAGGNSSGAGSGGGRGDDFQPPSAAHKQQLKLLVHQIEMAVQAGYVSPQFLLHPLPHQSLLLLSQLLQAVKHFQQLTQAQSQMGKSNSNAALQLSVQITKTKLQINNLHNQIAAQQAQHNKSQQQQQQQHHHLGSGNQPNNDFYKPPTLPDSGVGRGGGLGNNSVMEPMMSAIPGNFNSDFGLKDTNQHQQSRLTQWTKMDKDDGGLGSDFSRAPGPQSSNSVVGGLKSNQSLMLGQSDNTWSTATSRSGGDGWPTDHTSSSVASASTLNDDQSAKPGASVNLNANDTWPSDLVPEFEPGKPWKGTQILKSVEDDPTLTPGSVVRSPLSLAAFKDSSEFLGKNASLSSASTIATDTQSTPLSLGSSTWSFTPTTGAATNPSSMAQMNQTKQVWGDDVGRRCDLWDYHAAGSSSIPGSRPPPGLPKKGTGVPTSAMPPSSGSAVTTMSSNNPSSSFSSYRNNSASLSWGTAQPGGSGAGPSNAHLWLFLRNLTPQIDGSTLKTLCLQHGPLQKFHLFLNHGVALVKYSTREEAAKAQNALNNCVLGNTTILAETPSENEVQNVIQAGGVVSNAQTATPSSTAGSGGGTDNPWGTLRDSSPLWGNSPWGSSGLDTHDRATPSSMNSLLPGDLLGGESA